MKISTILDHVDSGHFALPVFQRGYVWNRGQVRRLFQSLYKGHPVGGLLVWITETDSVSLRGQKQSMPGMVTLLLDGQQRITTLYSVLRGKPPDFFDGNPTTLTGLHFHLETEEFEFYTPITMRDDPLWVDVTGLMRVGLGGVDEICRHASQAGSNEHSSALYSSYMGKLLNLLQISDTNLHVEEVTGSDKSLNTVVEIFNCVNSAGTMLSKGDLALARICAIWPEAREEMKEKLQQWEDAGYGFDLIWLLRSVNAMLTGKAQFIHLDGLTKADVQKGLVQACRHIDTILNLIGGKLGLDHHRVLFGRYAIPVMVRYCEQKSGSLTTEEHDKLLFWYVQAAMWGRFSGSTETEIERALSILNASGNEVDALIEDQELWHHFRITPHNFDGSRISARFYPVLYMLTRMGEARDWGTNIPLKANMLGKMNQLEVHHIFPTSRLMKLGYDLKMRNAVSNFCLLTKDTNLKIRASFPEDYFAKVEEEHPGALASQWIPNDRDLWKIENYPDFLEARKILLAKEANRRLAKLLHVDEQQFVDAYVGITSKREMEEQPVTIGDVADDIEMKTLSDLNDWAKAQGFAAGELSHEYSDPDSGEQLAVFDLVWPDGLQQGLTQPVAVLLNEDAEVIGLANTAGFRCFTSPDAFKNYVNSELLAVVPA